MINLPPKSVEHFKNRIISGAPTHDLVDDMYMKFVKVHTREMKRKCKPIKTSRIANAIHQENKRG